MKRLYLTVLATAFACASAYAATNTDVDTADNVGFTPLAVAVTEVDAIAKAIQGYVDKFHTPPPSQHQKLFPLLAGQNPQKYRFLSLESLRMNARGEVVDPWKEPYRIEKQAGRIIVSSRKMHYVRAIRLPEQPVKSAASHPAK
jgi:hypothetical protein